MLRLLIVDDASPIADELTRCLKEDGIEACCEHASTQSGLREALRREPDVVLVNLDASRVPARVALSIVRSVSAATPVIALSLLMRYRSLQEDTFSGKLVAALRNEFGGHAVTKADVQPGT